MTAERKTVMEWMERIAGAVLVESHVFEVVFGLLTPEISSANS